jgi:predicted ester cyclase
LIAARLTWSGTQKGTLLGKYEPTNKHAVWTEIFIGRIENGKIVEGWEEFDLAAMYEQLGINKTAGRPE